MTRSPARPVVLLKVLVLLAACQGPPGSPQPPANEPHPFRDIGTGDVIIVSVDTLRPDHLGAYGYRRPTSPRIDAFRRESVLFRTVVAQAPSTLPSHASIFTSLLPAQHGASFTQRTGLAPAAVTLAETLFGAGRRTGAVAGGGQMAPGFGLDQGFESYEVTPTDALFRETVSRGLAWLDRHPEPTFLFLHSYEVHHPYTPRPDLLSLFEPRYTGSLPDRISKDLLTTLNRGERPIDVADLAHVVATYDAEIRSMDEGFGELVDGLRARGRYDSSLLVFTSDHGEELGDHGVVGWHAHTLYDELLRVPLLLRLPGGLGAGTVVETMVRSLDVAPSVLDAVGVQIPDQFVGRSLLPLVAAPVTAWDEVAVSRRDSDPALGFASLRTEKWKLYPRKMVESSKAWGPGPWWVRWGTRLLVRVRPHRLYDLEADPGETRDVSLRHPLVARRLADRRQVEIDRREPVDAVRVEPTESTMKELDALGYLD